MIFKELSVAKSCLRPKSLSLALYTALPSQYSFLQDFHRCTKVRGALLCKFFLLLTLKKFLSNEFLAGKIVINKSYKITLEFQEIIAKESAAQ